MAHPDYIAAAKQSNRTPTVFMKVESGDGQTLYYTTESDWAGSDTLTNIDTTEEPGSVINTKFNQDAAVIFLGNDAGGNLLFAQQYTAAYDQFLNGVIHTVAWRTDQLGQFVNVRVKITNTNPDTTTPTITHYADQVLISPDVVYGNGLIGVYSSEFDVTSISHDVLLSEEWWVSVEIFASGVWVLAGSGLAVPSTPRSFAVNAIKPISQVETSPIDFGAVTATNPIFSVDDVTESGALISYSYEYSDAGSIYTPGGSIVDGDSLVASRFYKITADLTTSTGGRGKIREIQLEEGLFLFFGSHIDEPFSGVSPQLVPNSVSSFSQKISIGKGLSTTGQSTVKMFWVPETSNLIASGYLRGQDVSIYSGFKGLSTEAYEPVMVGTWFDHSLDEVAGEITVKIQDAFKQFEKRGIPEEEIDNTDGSIDTTPIVYSATSLVTVMKDVFDQIGLRDRYISPDFDTLEAGEYAAAKYKVSRTLSKSTESNKLLDELAQTGSMFLIPLGNGQIKPKPFDINQEHTATLDADFIDFVNLKGNLDKFFSRFYSYYNPKTTLTADPTDDRDDYDNGVALLDTNAELRWFPEKGIKQWFDKWKVGRSAPATPLTVPPQALIDKNVLDNALLTEPLYTMTAKKLGPKFADIEPADVVQVNNLELPVVDNEWTSAATYNNESVSVTSEDNSPQGLFISSDGIKLFIIGFQNKSVYQYTMSIPFDVGTAVYDSVLKSVNTEETSPTGVYFKNDGKSFYIVGSTNSTVFQYTLTTAWDLSTASYSSKSKDISSEGTFPQDLAFADDGLKMYVLCTSFTKTIYQYSLSTAWDVGTAIYDSKLKTVATEEAGPTGLFLKTDGYGLFVTGQGSDSVNQYTMGVKWDISTAEFNNISKSINSEESAVTGVTFTTEGSKMYIVGITTDTVYAYDMTTPFTLEATDYTEGDRVIHDGKMWRARQDSTGKDPTSEAAFWQYTEITSEGFTNGKHFFVLGRKFNPNDALIELDLMEMPPGTLGAFSADEFSSDFDIG